MRPGTTLFKLAALSLLSLVGCSKEAAPPSRPTEVVVFAAASLTESLTEVARAFEAARPGTTVRLNFSGSQTLAAQILDDAPADLFLSADKRWMEQVQHAGSVVESHVLLRNSMVIVATSKDSLAISSAADLARPGLRIVLAAEQVPAGRYAREALDKLGIRSAAESNVVSSELDVKGVLGKVLLGEADAGMVYATDVRPEMLDRVRVIALPDSAQVRAEYFAGRLADCPNPADAQAFLQFMGSPEADAVFLRYNFELP